MEKGGHGTQHPLPPTRAWIRKSFIRKELILNKNSLPFSLVVVSYLRPRVLTWKKIKKELNSFYFISDLIAWPILSFKSYGKSVLKRFIQHVPLDLRICVKDARIAPLLVHSYPSIVSIILTLYCAPLPNLFLKWLLSILQWSCFNGCLKPDSCQLKR